MIQEDITKAVANELKETLGIGKSFKQLGGTDNVEAYELYLVGQGLKLDGGKASSKRALESLDAVIALDPEFALAWSEKAFLHEIMSLYVSTDQASAELDAGLNAAQRAIEIEPNLAEVYASLGSIRSAAGDWIEAELAFRKAFELATEPSQVIMSYPPFLFAVGYFEKAFQFLETVRSSDPLSPIIRRNYITNLGFFGDIQRAEEENERIKALLGEQWIGHFNEIITEVRLGTGDSVSSDEISVIPFLGNIEIESKENGLAELHRLYDSNDISVGYLSFIPLMAAYLGDHELAMDVMEKMTSLGPKSVFYIWFPVFGEVRQTPRFKKLVKDIGLVDYWNKFGWPDICHQLDNGDFECD